MTPLLLMLASTLLVTALAATNKVEPQARMDPYRFVAESQFSDIHDMIIATHGVNPKSGPKFSVINGEKMVKLGESNLSYRYDITKNSRANTQEFHQVTIAVKQRNTEKLEQILYDVSDPQSPLYGKHWSKERMEEFTANPTSSAFVKNFFKKRGAKILYETKCGEYVTIKAPVKVFESIFQTEFFEFSRTGKSAKIFIRAEEAFLPQVLLAHVQYIFDVIDFPDELPVVDNGARPATAALEFKREEKNGNIVAQGSDTIPGMVTPALLNSYYKIPSNTGSSATSQAVYESSNQSYSSTDLSSFQTRFNLPQEAVAANIGRGARNYDCTVNSDDCLLANSDLQYIMAVAQGVPTTYYYDKNWMVKFVTSVANMTEPPKVISISYQQNEPTSQSYIDTFDTEAMKLGIMGVTIIAASGNDGVSSSQARNQPIYCGYYPSFPASSPYVTAVGGTFGPENNQPEVACTSDAGGLITSGGGFSNMYSTPSWQQSQVTGYFNKVLGTNIQPAEGYNAKGRGYPDVSALAASYAVMVNGNLTSVYGTSSSTPVFAGMISLVNAARVGAGKSNLGWINPSIYQFQSSIILNDIVIGENNCVAGHTDAVCCSQGFYATPGWDPVSGIGSIDFTKFQTTFLALGDNPNVPTNSPTVTPGSPTNMPVTAPPTATPTAGPTTSNGWLTYSIYSMESCTGNANVVTGVPTNDCLLLYSTDTGVVVGSQRYSCNADSSTATITTYSDQGCTQNPSDSTLFLGCTPEYTTTTGLKQSTSLTCTAGSLSSNSLPIPEPGSGSAIYSTHLSYDQKLNSCLDSDISGFTSFLNGVCFSEVSGDASFSQIFSFPNIYTFTEANCPSRSKGSIIVEEESCIPNASDDIVTGTVSSQVLGKKHSNLKQKKAEKKNTVTKKTEGDVSTENYYYSYYGGGIEATNRVYGRAVQSSVSASSTNSNGSDDFFDNKPAVSIVFIIVGSVATLLIGVIVYYACFAKSSSKDPLLSNHM